MVSSVLEARSALGVAPLRSIKLPESMRLPPIVPRLHFKTKTRSPISIGIENAPSLCLMFS